jgi:hypothetical protein
MTGQDTKDEYYDKCAGLTHVGVIRTQNLKKPVIHEAQKTFEPGVFTGDVAGELGSTIAVSCDMCHPHASNTHPETYPKFQRQLGRVVLLRDMINWCVEHPVRGKALDAEDPRMRAMEAYIYAQRRGKTLEYGKL